MLAGLGHRDHFISIGGQIGVRGTGGIEYISMSLIEIPDVQGMGMIDDPFVCPGDIVGSDQGSQMGLADVGGGVGGTEPQHQIQLQVPTELGKSTV